MAILVLTEDPGPGRYRTAVRDVCSLMPDRTLRPLLALVLALPIPAQDPSPPRAVFRGVPADTWLQRLQTEGDDERLRQASIAGLALCSENPAIAAQYAALLQERPVTVRRQAAWLLGSAGATVVPALIAALTDPDGEVRENAARALASNGAASASATPILIELLERQGDELDGQLAADALAAIGTAHADAIPALIRNLVIDGAVSQPMRVTLVNMGAMAVPALTGALRDAERAEPAALALVDLSDGGHAVDLDAVMRAVGERSPAVAMRVARARARVDPAAIVPFLRAWLLVGAEHDREEPDVEVMPAAVPHLLPAFTDGDGRLRHLACRVVQATAAPLPGVVLALGEALQDEDATVRSMAAHALVVHAKDAPAACLEPLVASARRRVEDPGEEAFAGTSCLALGTLAAAHAGARDALRDLAAGKADVAPWAALALARNLLADAERPAWLQRALTAPSDYVRSVANGLPGASSAATAPAVLRRAHEILGAARADGDSEPRSAVLWDLYHLREHAAPAARLLATHLDDDDLELRRPALAVAANIGAASPELFAPVLALAKGEDPEDLALRALGGFGASAKPAIPLLIAALSAPEQDRQRAACEALAQLGSLADAEIEQVLAAADPGADNVDAAYFAAEAWQSRGVAAAAPLAKAVRSDSPAVRGHAVLILANIDGLRAAAVAATRVAVIDPHWFVRGAAATAIGVLGADEPLPEALLADPDGYVRMAARQVLAERARQARPPR